MPVQPTYPGVYVQELASPVHTITGVSTSIAMFVGRAAQGPITEPVLCLSYRDFDRAFTSDTTFSDLPRAVSLFFLNGGTQCYVLRIVSSDAVTPATVTLKNGNSQDTLQIKALSVGSIGNSIRCSVSYNTQAPESTFNMTFFNWTAGPSGQRVMANTETYTELSMNPNSSNYAITVVNQNSSLVQISAVAAGSKQTTGYSQSGLFLPSTETNLLNGIKSILNNPNSNNIQVSINGSTPALIDLTPALLNITDILEGLASAINGPLGLSGSNAVTVVDIGSGTTGEQNVLFRIVAPTNGDINISPAPDNDVAVALMLGTTQGGLEVSSYANARPAPNGIVFDTTSSANGYGNLLNFEGLAQNGFDTITINGTNIYLYNPLVSTPALLLETISSSAFMYQDKQSGNNGLIEKLIIIQNAINNAAIPNFNWSAEIWGSRLALIPGAGNNENFVNTISTSYNSGITPLPANVTNIRSSFIQNVQYYSLGSGGLGYQEDGVSGTDGLLSVTGSDYSNAYQLIDNEVDLFNLLILPKDNKAPVVTNPETLWGAASVFCQKRRAVLLVDPPTTWTWNNVQDATNLSTGVNKLRIGLVNDYSALYYPQVQIQENGATVSVAPSGAIAGLIARIDATNGVWQSPAGTLATLLGVSGLNYKFTDAQNGILNPKGINTLRIFPDGLVSWGARTLDGDDNFGSDYKYLCVRRTALFIEESLYRGLKWVVFQPNDARLWAQIRLNVGAFMQNLFRQGAFQNITGKNSDSYFVQCDSSTTTQNDIDMGIVNVVVGFAPLKPAEFVILTLQQMAGQVQV